MSNVVNCPALPYVTMIPGGFPAGSAIVFKGKCVSHKDKRFAFNLSTGLLVDGDHRDDIAVQFNPRFDTGTVILNHMVNNRWGVEQIYPISGQFEADKPFEVRILGLANLGYKVAVNGRHFCDFPHKIPMEEVKTLYIWGCVELDYIEFQPANTGFTSGGSGGGAWGGGGGGLTSGDSNATPTSGASSKATPPYPTSGGGGGGGFMPYPSAGQQQQPHSSPYPSLAPYAHANAPPPAAYQGAKGIMPAPRENVDRLPFEIRVPGDGLALGQRLDLTVTVKRNAHKFNVDFMSGQDIAFHFNPRFADDGSVDAVRNTRRHGVWEAEERQAPGGRHFARGETVDLGIWCQQAGFDVSVNGSYFVHYKHRMAHTMIDCIRVDGDVKLLRAYV